MNRTYRHTTVLAMTAAALVCGAAHGGVTLLQDDFNDGVLDPAKWTVNNNIPQGGASVVETGGQVQLTNRGHLVTKQQFDPDQVGGLRITGRWTFSAAPNDFNDLLQILTRSNGIPSGQYGETGSGVTFLASAAVQGWPTMSLLGQTAPLHTDPGDVFDFTIIDDGLNLSFTLQEVGGQGATASISATLVDNKGADHVVFHNRERYIDNRVAKLDNVVISTLLDPLRAAGVAPAPLDGKVTVDIGARNHRVHPGHIAPFNRASGSSGGLSDLALPNFDLSIDNVDTTGAAVGAVDWRDRGDFADDGELFRLAEDFVKNTSGVIRLTLDDLAPGTYQMTSYHIDVHGDQSDLIKVYVDTGDGYELMPDTGDSSFYERIDGTMTEQDIIESAATFTFTTTGSGPVHIVFDGRDSIATFIGDAVYGTSGPFDQTILNGFELTIIPEPASAVLLAAGALALTSRRRASRMSA